MKKIRILIQHILIDLKGFTKVKLLADLIFCQVTTVTLSVTTEFMTSFHIISFQVDLLQGKLEVITRCRMCSTL